MVREQCGSKPIIHVLVADNSLMHTQLLGDALKRDKCLRVISSSSNTKSIVEATLEHHFDVLLISSNMEEQPDRGLELLRDLCESRPTLRAVVLLDSPQAELILEAFRAGARGVLTRFESVQTLSKCVRCVHDGQIWASSEQISLALGALASAHTVHASGRGLSLLSKREIEIVQSLAEGLTNREIAQRLGLSQHTVKNYLFRVFDKTGASNRMELLFMLLGPNSSTHSPLNELSKADSPAELPDAVRMAEYQQAAERGVLVAQLLLAQFLLYRKATPDDTVEAYKWYLIAKNQILQASKALGQTLTVEQLLHAEQFAANWSKNVRQSSTFSDTVFQVRKANPGFIDGQLEPPKSRRAPRLSLKRPIGAVLRNESTNR
jgi:two-component system, NarL family, nitrate/nitrite response regulator NarL